MIQAWVTGEGGGRALPIAEVKDALASGSASAWIDLESESEATVRDALSPLGVHPLVYEDMVANLNRPKVDDYGEYLYLVVHSARWDRDDARPVLREIDFVLGPRLLVSYHEGETRSCTAAHGLMTKRPDLLVRGPAYLLHYMLDVLVDHWLPIVDRIADEVDELEDRAFVDEGAAMHARILRLKRGISALRRIVGPQRDTLLALTRDEFRAVPAEIRPYLRDVYDRLARVTDLLDSFRDEIGALLELHVSLTSNRLNEVVKRLTVIGTIGLPLTVVTSYYGMNFQMREYTWKNGEWFVLLVLAVTAALTWLYLRWRKWW